MMNFKTVLATAVACLFASTASVRAADLTYTWYTVANNGDLIPGTGKLFNSYNQPAVNKDGMVVFRARSRGGEGGQEEGQPEHGIYMRDLGEYGPIVTVFRRRGLVPEPNNTTDGSSGDPASFNEFPSIPRIDSGSDTIATRGQSQPVWEYTLPDGTEARTGTAGVYANPAGVPTTAASMVGDVPGFEYFQVPIAGLPSVTGFDQFPGSPAVTERDTIVFKGNFIAEGVGKTGVFYRHVVANKGVAPIELIASSYTDIPGCTPDLTQAPPRTCKFGSTAPPSADGKYAVFAGYDNEAAPTLGGIYRARLGTKPITLQTVVRIGDHVPGEADGVKFQVFGEAVTVASNGRLVVFWGGWGGTHVVTMACPDEGNEAMRAACDAATPPGTTRPVPNHQGFFVRDMQLGTTTVIAKTDDHLTDFVYWNFSGRVEGKGEGGDDVEEPARWRSATFAAVSGSGVPSVSAFKATSADGEQGIYLRKFLPPGMGNLITLLKTGDPGETVDLLATGMKVTALGIERDGFRGNWLALSVSMATDAETMQAGKVDSQEVTGWAGIYVARFFDNEEISP
jgi:hypothetical protein